MTRKSLSLNGAFSVLAIATLLGTALSGCSDEVKAPAENPTDQEETLTETASMTVVSDPATLGKYVRNYATLYSSPYSAGRSRALSATSMPALSSWDKAKAAASTVTTYQTWDNISSNFVLASDHSGELKVYPNQIIFIEGNVSTDNIWGEGADNGASLVVLPGATLTIEIQPLQVSIYNYGTLNLTSADGIDVHAGNQLMTTGDLGTAESPIPYVHSCQSDTKAGDIYVGGTLYVDEWVPEYGNHYAANVEANTAGIGGDVYIANKFTATNCQVRTTGRLYAKCAYFDDWFNATNGSISKFGNYMVARGIDELFNNDGNCPAVALYIDADAAVEICDGGVIESKKGAYLANLGTSVVQGPETGSAVFKVAGNIRADGGVNDYTKTFRNHLAIFADSFTDGGSDTEVCFANTVNVLFNPGACDFTQAAGECSPAINMPDCEDPCPDPEDPSDPDPDPDPDPEVPEDEPFPSLPTLADIDACHTHPISATSVAIDGNNAYVSWHLRGGNIWGCLEKFTIANDEVTLNSWLETPAYLGYTDTTEGAAKGVSGAEITNITNHGTDAANAYDFNHCIVSNGYLITVGDHKDKGGFVGRVLLTDIAANANGTDILQVRGLGKGDDNIAGGSGNCVVRKGDELFITSAGGYLTMDYATNGLNFNVVATKKQTYSPWIDAMASAGSVKHIALSPDGTKAVTIEYTAPYLTGEWWNDDTSTLSAAIKVWDVTNGWDYEKPTQTIAVDAFGPVFGKDVIAIENDGTIYSCQGWNGVAVYRGGSEVARIDIPAWLDANAADKGIKINANKYRGSAANGLCIDDNYVYVANGGAGVWVLAKGDLAPQSYYHNSLDEQSGASANYVAKMGTDYLIVAYGRSGVRVLKLN